MKKKLIIIGVVLIVVASIVGTYFILSKDKIEKIKQEKNELIELHNVDVEFLSKFHVSDNIKFIDGKIVDDYLIDTTKVGKQKVDFVYKTEDNLKIDYSYEINVVDTTPPIIWLSGSYTVNKGSDISLTEKILCGDNYDNKPDCVVNGEYDLNKVGSYKLEFVATDSSGNKTSKDFTLYVKEPSKAPDTTSNASRVRTNFSDVYKEFKTDKTEIGIDVSKWQGDIDFNKLKAAGVDFIIIRVGTANGIDGDYLTDKKFEQNIKNANALDIPVGIYYYSYANSSDRAIADAKWVIEKIKPYKVDLPVAFDWESWGSFNKFNLSFFGLTSLAGDFIKTVEDAGYEGLLYGSKTYLENMWIDMGYPIWLAHYTKKTSYTGDYKFWQMCSNGKVDGIDGDVDIDIRYLD